MFDANQRQQAVQDERDLAEMNRLIDAAGRIADGLVHRGYDVNMTLWDENRPGSTVRGRFSWNVAKVSMRESIIAR